jgi:DNA-binding response OmpR family regulator
MASDAAQPRVLVVDADEPLAELLEQWLEADGRRAVRDGTAELVIVDLPNPRAGAAGVLGRLARERPGVPVLALSSNFLPGIESCGAVARWLGVAAALPKPVARDALLAVVGHLLSQTLGHTGAISIREGS